MIVHHYSDENDIYDHGFSSYFGYELSFKIESFASVFLFFGFGTGKLY
jgi:hypothetical protein